MQRSRKGRRFHHGGAAARLDERHLVVPADLVGDSDAVIELHQVCAKAKEDVLAVVNDFARARLFPGRGPAAEEGTLLE